MQPRNYLEVDGLSGPVFRVRDEQAIARRQGPDWVLGPRRLRELRTYLPDGRYLERVRWFYALGGSVSKVRI